MFNSKYFCCWNIVLVILVSSCSNKNISQIKFNQSDDYSNIPAYIERRMFNRVLDQQKNIHKIKVIYNDSIYFYTDFKKLGGFDNTKGIVIITDSLEIKKYHVNDCVKLIIVK